MKRNLSLFSFFTTLLYLLCFSFSQAATIHVPGDYPNIQQAILFASNGDTVLVGPGIWMGLGNENISLLGKKIVVLAEKGPEETTVSGTGTGTGFRADNNETPDSKIIGFRIINFQTGVYIYNANPLITDCLIDSVQNYGMSISLYATDNIYVENCIIRNSNGGGMSINAANNNVAYIQNCLLYGNKYGASTNGSVVFINCIVAGNNALSGTAGIYHGDLYPGSLVVKNSIVWGNQSSNTFFPNLYSLSAEVSNSDIGGAWPGLNNINADPLFTDPANGNYRLQPNSPCIDAGANAPINFPTDLDGNARIWDGNGDGLATADMGAYEFGAPLYVPLAITLQPSGASVCAGTDVVFSVGANGTGLNYQWKKNGINIPNATDSILTLGNVTISYAGTYTCVVSDFSGATVSSTAAVLQVTPVTPVNVSIAAPMPLCSGVPITFTATATGGGNTPSYQWQLNGNNTGSDSPAYTTTLEPGAAITCILTSSVVCPSANPVVSNALTVLPSPDAGIASNAPLCEGDVLTLTASGGAAYFWQGPAGFTSTQATVNIPNVTASASGVYSVTVTDQQGCTDSGMANILVNELPEVSFDCMPAVVYDTASVFSLDCGTPDGGTYLCDGVPCDSFSPANAGTGQHEIIYTFTDANGCTGSDTAVIVVAMTVSTQENEMKMPVIIFPNPSRGWLTLQAEGLHGIARLEIWNAPGQVLKVHTLQIDSPFRYELDLNALPKGMYSIRLYGDGWTTTRSISIH